MAQHYRISGLRLLLAHRIMRSDTAEEFQRRQTTAAPPGSRTLVLPGTDERPLGYDLQELAEPVKAWFREQL